MIIFVYLRNRLHWLLDLKRPKSRLAIQLSLSAAMSETPVLTSRPSVILVHGSWHTNEYFGPLRSLLEAKGYPTIAPLLPTTGGTPGKVGLHEDAAVVRAEIKKLVDQGKDVILVMHSYGGLVGSQAVEGFGKASRKQHGLSGGVIHMAFITAFLLPEGSSLAAAIAAKLEGETYMMPNPETKFYNDLSEEEQKLWVAKLKPIPVACHTAPLTHAGWQHVPVSYLFCENDIALPIQLRERMVATAKEAGVTVWTKSCTSGHSPMLSQPEVVAKFIFEACDNGVHD